LARPRNRQAKAAGLTYLNGYCRYPKVYTSDSSLPILISDLSKREYSGSTVFTALQTIKSHSGSQLKTPGTRIAINRDGFGVLNFENGGAFTGKRSFLID
jgi:hypothetical protein